MHNYVYLKEKELIRLTEFITYYVKLIDLIDEDHQKVRQIVRCLLSGNLMYTICCNITKTAHHWVISPYQ